MCIVSCILYGFFFFKQKTAYDMRISDWSSDVCSSDLGVSRGFALAPGPSTRDGRASTGNDIQHVADIHVADIEEMRMTSSLMARRCMWFGLAAMALALAPASQAQDFDPENPYTVEADGTRSEEHTSELQSLMRH